MHMALMSYTYVLNYREPLLDALARIVDYAQKTNWEVVHISASTKEIEVYYLLPNRPVSGALDK